ncbi:hypothetical protein ACIPN8_17115 [Streptomyces sp. NPDC086082]|uniref:hypothetical protein n=1 Tax=Streptomyces sp. NPDC086082 TaxID=3365750 RepID=UPI0038087048
MAAGATGPAATTPAPDQRPPPPRRRTSARHHPVAGPAPATTPAPDPRPSPQPTPARTKAVHVYDTLGDPPDRSDESHLPATSGPSNSPAPKTP